jgi:hypothetical protein
MGTHSLKMNSLKNKEQMFLFASRGGIKGYKNSGGLILETACHPEKI